MSKIGYRLIKWWLDGEKVDYLDNKNNKDKDCQNAKKSWYSIEIASKFFVFGLKKNSIKDKPKYAGSIGKGN